MGRSGLLPWYRRPQALPITTSCTLLGGRSLPQLLADRRGARGWVWCSFLAVEDEER